MSVLRRPRGYEHRRSLARRSGLTKSTTGYRRHRWLSARLPEAAWLRRRLTKAATRLAKTTAGLTEAARLALSTRLAKATRRPLSTWLAEATGLARAAKVLTSRTGLRRRREIDERPLVVGVHPVVQLDRGLLALRRHALNAHRQLSAWRAGPEATLRAGLLPEAATSSAAQAAEARTRPCPGGCRAGARLRAAGPIAAWRGPTEARPAWLSTADRNELKVVVGDGIFVFLPEEALLHQDVDAGREGVGVLALEQHDGATVLLAAPDEFLFALALRGVTPHRQRGPHQDRHDAHAHEERRHGVAALVSAPALTR